MGTTAKINPGKPPKTRVRGELAEWIVTFVVLVFGTSLMAEPMVIPTSSMHNTLLTGDHLIVDKIAYSPPGPLGKFILPYESVKRGDIIVFRNPVLLVDYVKRVIGVSGDRIKIVHKQVYRNGRPLNEPYAIHIDNGFDPYRDDFPNGGTLPYAPFPGISPDHANNMLQKYVVNGELVVPDGAYFAMGDNRDNSLDSRYWGLVPRQNITGKPVFIFWSYDAETKDLEDYSIHHFVDLAEHFFTKTRWDRTFKLIHGDNSDN